MADGDPMIAKMRLSHHDPHCHYVNITLDDEVKELVKDMKNLTPRQVCISLKHQSSSEDLIDLERGFDTKSKNGIYRKTDSLGMDRSKPVSLAAR